MNNNFLLALGIASFALSRTYHGLENNLWMGLSIAYILLFLVRELLDWADSKANRS